MTVSPQDAARALKDVEQVAGRSSALRNYRAATPALILWGLVWIVVSVCCDRWPQHAGLLWGAGDLVGIVGTTVIGVRFTGSRPGRWRDLATAGVAIATAMAAVNLLQIRSVETLTALVALGVGGAYMAWGVWRGARFFVLGLIIAVVSLAAGLLHPPHFYLWIAGAGGGALILGGLWLRRT
ncbi:MAG TPA: hypothetical protein VIJ94_10060 [Caulobacteraceae bacterium]